MSDIKNKVQGIDPNVKARDVIEMASASANIYETINIINVRAKQLSADIKTELHQKLEEFAITTDTIEEIQENKEQIEISKFYERLPSSTVIATEEFLEGNLDFKYRGQKEDTETED